MWTGDKWSHSKLVKRKNVPHFSCSTNLGFAVFAFPPAPSRSRCMWSRRSRLSTSWRGMLHTHTQGPLRALARAPLAHMCCSSPDWALISHWNCVSAYDKTTSKPSLLKLRISVVRNEVSTGTQLWETHFLTGNALWFCRMRIAQNHSRTQHIGSSLLSGWAEKEWFPPPPPSTCRGAHLKKRLGYFFMMSWQIPKVLTYCFS